MGRNAREDPFVPLFDRQQPSLVRLPEESRAEDLEVPDSNMSIDVTARGGVSWAFPSRPVPAR